MYVYMIYYIGMCVLDILYIYYIGIYILYRYIYIYIYYIGIYIYYIGILIYYDILYRYGCAFVLRTLSIDR